MSRGKKGVLMLQKRAMVQLKRSTCLLLSEKKDMYKIKNTLLTLQMCVYPNSHRNKHHVRVLLKKEKRTRTNKESRNYEKDYA